MGTGQKGKKYINFTLFLQGAQQREAVIAVFSSPVTVMDHDLTFFFI